MFGKNLRTTLSGAGGWLATLALLLKCFIDGHFDIMCAIAVLFGGSVSTGLLLAKDGVVTGGTVPATVEAEKRVKGHGSAPSEL